MLYGRDVELERIDALLDGVRASRSGVLVLLGDPGIGKSSLLAHAVERADGMRVLEAGGLESESELAFAGLYQLLRPVLGTLDRLPAPQATALRGAFGLEPVPVEDRFLTSVAVLTLLSEVAGDEGLLCVIDDVQWLDDPSIDTLLFVARRLHADAVAMLLSARVGEARELDRTGLPELRVEGLDADAARALLADRAGSEIPPGVGEAIVAAAGGNPLALIELPVSLTGAQLAGRDALPTPLPVGAGIEAAFLARVRRLDGAAQTLLLLAAADDTGDLATILRAADGLGADAAACDAVEAAGLIAIDDGALQFRHPLVRSVVYRSATFNRRRTAHEALAAALDADADADRRAWHRAAGTLGPDEGVAAELERSARTAARRSGHSAAATALERAAELSPRDETRGRRLVAAAEESWLAGRSERVRPLLARAHPVVSDPRLQAAVSHLDGGFELECGTPAAAYDRLVRGAAEIVGSEPALGLQMLVRAAEASWLAGDARWAAEIERLTAAVPARGDVERLMVSLLVGAAAMMRGDAQAAVAPMREALTLAEGLDDPRVLLSGAVAALALADVASGCRLYARAVAGAREAGAVGSLPLALHGLALSELLDGRLSSADANASEGLKLARETGQENFACYLLAILARVAGLQGRAEACRAYAREALAIATARGLRLQAAVATWALAELELPVRPDEALALLQRHEGDPVAAHPWITLIAAPSRVEAAVRAGRGDAGEPPRAGFRRWAEATGSTWAGPIAARLDAMLEPGPAAGERFEAAVLGHQAAGHPLEMARTQLLYGEWLRRERRRIDAREHLRAALEAFERLGARPWAERARTELRASGETARSRDPSTIDQLTPQELQIARFVSEGATNREVAAQLFLSPRTIDYHLRSVFRKLGVASRRQLGQVLAGDGPAAEAGPLAAAVAPSS